MTPASDHNFLLGVLALRMGFAGREEVLRAMNAWAANQDQDLGQILVRQNALGEAERTALEMAAQNHLQRHGDLTKSLAAMEAGPMIEDLVESGMDQGLSTQLGASVAGLTAAGMATGVRAKAASSGGRFRPLRSHASGGLGEVFLARDEELGRDVALKEIHSWLAEDPHLRARFVLEAEITGGLEHPGIVPVYGLGYHEDGRPYYAMRFIRGESLMESIRRFHEQPQDSGDRTVMLRKLLGCFVTVCNAVAYAHSRGVIHRDLKPENVMLGPYGETLVVDWGLAKLVGSRATDGQCESVLEPASAGERAPTQLGAAVGTLAYMSPEQAAGQVDQLGPATDIYALGATLYVILTGQRPIQGTNYGEIVDNVIAGRFPRPRAVHPQVPAALEAICLKAMALDPARRYQTAGQLADDVESWLADGPVQAWREPFRVRAGRWLRRHRSIVSGAAAAALVALVSLSIGVVLLALANDEIRNAKTVAENNAVEARENLQTALGAVDNFLIRVSQDPRLRAHNLEPLRRELLEIAVPFYQQFTQRKPEDPQLRYQWAWAKFRLANIVAETGTKARAIELLEDSLNVLEPLAEEYPENQQYKNGLEKCWLNLGVFYAESGRPEDARKAYQAAMAVNDELLVMDSGSADFQNDRASLHNNLAQLALEGRELDRAEVEFRRALAIRGKLADAHPAEEDYHATLANNQTNLGALLHRQGHLEEAAGLMEDARKTQKALADRHPELPEYRRDLAATCSDLALLENELPGRTADAEAMFREALDAQQRLVQEHTDVAEYRRGLGRTELNLGAFYYKHGRTADAEAAWKRALEIHRQLVARHGDVPDYEDGLAAVLNNLGNLDAETKRPQEAEAIYREALGIRRGLVRKHPDQPNYQSSLAIANENLASLLVASQRLKEAEAVYREAIRSLEDLVKNYRHVRAYVVELGADYTKLGALLADRPEESLASYRKAMNTLGSDPALARDLAPVRAVLRNAHWGAAEALQRQGKYRDAVAELDQALALEPGPLRDLLRLGRAEAQARAGDHARAVAEAKDLAPAARNVGPALYRLAAVCALASAGAAKDASLTPSQRNERVDQDAATALEFLRQAKAAGYFRGPAQRKELEEDPALDSLRQRDEFKKLRDEVAGK